MAAIEEQIASDAAKARVVFSASGALDGPTHVTLAAREHTIEVDEPDSLGGADTAANPVEYALAALASCQREAINSFGDDAVLDFAILGPAGPGEGGEQRMNVLLAAVQEATVLRLVRAVEAGMVLILNEKNRTKAKGAHMITQRSGLE